MKSFLHLILITILFSCQNQHEQPALSSFNDSLCIEGERLAIDDFQQSKLRLFAEKITNEIYDSLLLSEYHIQTYDGSKRDDAILVCYVNAMDSLLYIKYKEDIRLSTHKRAQKIEYFNKTGISPEDIKVIDFGDRMQELYLITFLNIISKSDSSNRTRDIVKELLLKEGVSPKELELKPEIDTNGSVVTIHTNKPIKDSIKTMIVNEMNKNGWRAYFEIDGKRKNFILPDYYW